MAPAISASDVTVIMDVGVAIVICVTVSHTDVITIRPTVAPATASDVTIIMDVGVAIVICVTVGHTDIIAVG